MNTYRSTSKTRPSQATLDQRAAFDRQFDHAQIVANIPHLWSVVANVARMQKDALRNGWYMLAPDDWFQKVGSDICAEVWKGHGDRYTAIAWKPNSHAECGSFADGFEAMVWCTERLHAAALNAKAERLERTGAVDASEGGAEFEHKQYLVELADSKDDHDYSIPS